MFEGVVLSDVITWYIMPNIIAQFFMMINKAYYANIIYIPGYLCMFYHNFQIDDPSQQFYFIFFEISSIIGVIYYNYVIRKNVLRCKNEN